MFKKSFFEIKREICILLIYIFRYINFKTKKINIYFYQYKCIDSLDLKPFFNSFTRRFA